MPSRRNQTHECRHCKQRISLRHLYCKESWFRLPPWLRDELIATWKYGLQVRAHPTDDFLAAVRKAHAILFPKPEDTKGNAYANRK